MNLKLITDHENKYQITALPEEGQETLFSPSGCNVCHDGATDIYTLECITHNDEIITNATNLYGVSMHEGVSKIISLKL